MKKKVYITVGPPSIGKSHWIKKNLDSESYILISSDDATCIAAKQNKITYNQMFEYPLQENQKDNDGFYFGYTTLQLSRRLKVGEVCKDVLSTKGVKFKTPLYSEYLEVEVHRTLGSIVDQGLSWKTWAPKAYSLNNEAEIEAQRIFDAMVSRAKETDLDVVVDMTHMSQGARLRSLSHFKDLDVEKICVFFPFAGVETEILKIAQLRESLPDDPAVGPKTIPDTVFKRMFDNFEPVVQANFDKLIVVDNRPDVNNIIANLEKRINE